MAKDIMHEMEAREEPAPSTLGYQRWTRHSRADGSVRTFHAALGMSEGLGRRSEHGHSGTRETPEPKFIRVERRRNPVKQAPRGRSSISRVGALTKSGLNMLGYGHLDD
jgi:hypothetical protein